MTIPEEAAYFPDINRCGEVTYGPPQPGIGTKPMSFKFDSNWFMGVDAILKDGSHTSSTMMFRVDEDGNIIEVINGDEVEQKRLEYRQFRGMQKAVEILKNCLN